MSRVLAGVAATVLVAAGAVGVSATASAIDYGTLKSCADHGKAPGEFFTSGTCAQAREVARTVMQKRIAGAARQGIRCFVAPGNSDLTCMTRDQKIRVNGPSGEIHQIAVYCEVSGDPDCR